MHQLSLIEPALEPGWTNDDWQTPAAVAKVLASHVNLTDHARPIDHTIVEAGAGTGQIARFLPEGSHAVELKPHRLEQGRQRAPHCHWHQADYLTWGEPGTVDLVIGNPPFTRIVEFINHSFELLQPRGRLVFLAPCDTFHKPTLLEAIPQPFYLSEQRLVGRIAYLGPDGKPQRGRQVYDSIFTLWPLPSPHPNGIIWV
jgi:SAM-dependent methyltransferase